MRKGLGITISSEQTLCGSEVVTRKQILLM